MQQSMLGWFLNSLGVFWAVMLFLSMVVSFVLTLIVVIRGRGPLSGAALLLIVPLPFLVGILSALEGAIRVHMVIANSTVAPSPNELSAGTSALLVAPLAGMFLMGPGYLLASVGTFVRALTAKSDA